MSPDDSRIERVECAPTVITRYAGQRAYVGQASLDRQIQHMRIALSHPFDFFLMNDSDSFCLSPKIPDYLYTDDYIFANAVGEPRPHSSPYPKVALQPPYFISRKNLEKLVAVAPRIRAHEITPYIDWAMLAWSQEAGVPFKAFWDYEKDHGTPHPTAEIAADPWAEMHDRVRNHGRVMVHPIKDLARALALDHERKLYVNTYERPNQPI
jgi:hypothetical protein